MMTKLDALFTIKRRLSLTDALERLTPLQFTAKSHELRSSLEKVMPEKLQQSMTSNANFSTGGSKASEHDISQVNASDSIDQSVLATDARAAKSVIRLSNAIMPLLSYYTTSVSASAPEIKPSASPKKAGKNRAAAKAAGSSASTVDVQEVHHAFHGVLKHIRRLEAASSASTAALFGDKAETTPAPAPLPALVDEMMNVRSAPLSLLLCSALTDSFLTCLCPLSPSHPYRRTTRRCTRTSPLWRSSCTTRRTGTTRVLVALWWCWWLCVSNISELNTAYDVAVFACVCVSCSKRRQYESMLEQLHASERQNAALKSKLQAAQQQKEVAAQTALEKEKALQAALVHLGAAQVQYSTVQYTPC
jgi:hypothetical protein